MDINFIGFSIFLDNERPSWLTSLTSSWYRPRFYRMNNAHEMLMCGAASFDQSRVKNREFMKKERMGESKTESEANEIYVENNLFSCVF